MCCLIVLFVLVLVFSVVFVEDWVVWQKVDVYFVDVIEFIVMVIENCGLVVNYILYIVDMFQCIGVDIGVSCQIFDKVQIIEFCLVSLL